MQDSEQSYPFHQSETNRRKHHERHEQHEQHEPEHPLDDKEHERNRGEIADKELRRSAGRGPAHQPPGASTPVLPRGRVKNAVITGVIVGVVTAIVSIIIAFANVATYNQASKYASNPSNLPVSLAYTLLGIACLSYTVALAVCFIGGFITGKISVQRRLGFLAGFIAGLVNYAISFIISYIPNYPGVTHSGNAAGAGPVIGGIGVVILSFLIWGVIGGLISLFGAWVATRKHPYYIGY